MRDLIERIEALENELRWIGLFADVRSKDESKVFARVNRGALRTIRDRVNAILADRPPTTSPVDDRETGDGATQAALLEGVRIGINQAKKALRSCQYSPAPLTDGMSALSKLDHAQILSQHSAKDGE